MTTETFEPIKYKANFLLRRRYLRQARYPFNIMYNCIASLGIAVYAYYSYKYLKTVSAEDLGSFVFWAGQIFLAFLFIAIFLGAIFGIRYYHRDRNIMYRNFERFTLKRKKLEVDYYKLTGQINTACQIIRYGHITALTLLTDEQSGLKVLRIDASSVLLKTTGYKEDGTNTEILLKSPTQARYFPLY